MPVQEVGEPHRQFFELAALLFVRALHRHTNRDFTPLRVTFTYARNAGLREIHRLSRCPVDNGQPGLPHPCAARSQTRELHLWLRYIVPGLRALPRPFATPRQDRKECQRLSCPSLPRRAARGANHLPRLRPARGTDTRKRLTHRHHSTTTDGANGGLRIDPPPIEVAQRLARGDLGAQQPALQRGNAHGCVPRSFINFLARIRKIGCGASTISQDRKVNMQMQNVRDARAQVSFLGGPAKGAGR
jgi:hypothetical protein